MSWSAGGKGLAEGLRFSAVVDFEAFTDRNRTLIIEIAPLSWIELDACTNFLCTALKRSEHQLSLRPSQVTRLDVRPQAQCHHDQRLFNLR
tara:strand:+ start:187 stop:459 length:273 start_codon:yes stop_codon:yes gene_type:complete